LIRAASATHRWRSWWSSRMTSW